MGCFGDPTANDESEYPPNLCTWDCKHGAPSTKHDAVKFEGKKPVCCTDGTSTPTAAVMEDDFLCYCSLGIKPAFVWLPEPMGVLKMPKHKPCNTVCSKSKSWLMNDGIAYCCPKDA